LHDQEEAVTIGGAARGGGRRAPAVGLALALALCLSVCAGARGFAAGAAAAAPAGDPPASRAAYSVVDLDAIKKLMLKARGHAVLVHFWASWCFPCLQELPMIDKFARDMKPRGLEVLSLSLDDPERMGPRVGALLQKTAPNLTPAIAKFGDADNFIRAFSAQWEGAIPALFAYDQQGALRGTLIGETSRRELDDLAAELLKGAAKKK
jgi:thiol-disulfide isomerase/thioredoxin